MEEIENMDYEKRKELILGQTPQDIKQQCYKLCKKYIGGVWANISTDQFVLKRISGGLTNHLYHCLLSDELNPVNNEPKEVAIRIYGKKHFNNFGQKNERHCDSIVALLMAQNKLGPKLYGLFTKGEILEYVEVKRIHLRFLRKKLFLIHYYY
jgi:choline/ethanolamine kinase